MKMIHEFVEALGNPLAIVGLLGQALFFSRFLVQWVVSERRGQSVVPPVFWYLSLIGAVLLVIYAFSVRDPVFVIGPLTGMFVYARNIVLLRRTSQGGSAGPSPKA